MRGSIRSATRMLLNQQTDPAEMLGWARVLAAIEADPDLAALILTGLDDCSDVWRCCSNADSPPGPDVSPWIERPNRSRLWTVVRRQDDRDGDRGC